MYFLALLCLVSAAVALPAGENLHTNLPESPVPEPPAPELPVPDSAAPEPPAPEQPAPQPSGDKVKPLEEPQIEHDEQIPIQLKPAEPIIEDVKHSAESPEKESDEKHEQKIDIGNKSKEIPKVSKEDDKEDSKKPHSEELKEPKEFKDYEKKGLNSQEVSKENDGREIEQPEGPLSMQYGDEGRRSGFIPNILSWFFNKLPFRLPFWRGRPEVEEEPHLFVDLEPDYRN